ncbi:unnamed protein product [Scytosiphon promiscuus]
MLRLGGPMRVGGTKGTMQQCIVELEESSLPQAFKLEQIRSLLRYMREVDGLVSRISTESGFEADTSSYLEILCAKEDADLMRRVSSTRVLRQDFDEKRLEWQKQKKNVINAIGSMTARVLRFEDKERKTIALHALAFYKNVMATNDGAIPGESESTDGLIEQYKRHRTEISKIPMYADSILRMLKDIRKTVRASSKLQPGPNAFAQFLEEWWASVVQFLQQSSIVEAEKNAREVMQTLKKLKGKQEESKKKEISRLLTKLDQNAGVDNPQMPSAGRLSELLDPPAAAGPHPVDTASTPENTSSRAWGGGARVSPKEQEQRQQQQQQQQAPKRDRNSQSSVESELSTAVPTAVMIGDDIDLFPAFERLAINDQQQPQQHHRQQRVSFADGGASSNNAAPNSTGPSASTSRGATSRTTATEPVGGKGGGHGGNSGGSSRPALTLCVDVDVGEACMRHGGGSALRSPSSSGLQSPGTPMLGIGVGGVGLPSRVSWEEGSQGTTGTVDTGDMYGRHGAPYSGIPDSEDGDGCGIGGKEDEDEDDDDDQPFEVADDLDLGAVDLCATGTGVDGQTTYQDQDDLRLPPKLAEPPRKKGVEQERFSAALDFFRQEQRGKPRRPATSPRPPSPMRTAASFSTLPSGSSSLRSPRTATTPTNPFTPRFGGSGAMRVRTPSSRSRGGGGGEGKTKPAKTPSKVKARTVGRRRASAERDVPTAKDKLLANGAKNLSSGRGHAATTLGRSLSVYIPSSRSQATPTHRASRTPTIKSSRRALMSPGVRSFTRGAFFG